MTQYIINDDKPFKSLVEKKISLSTTIFVTPTKKSWVTKWEPELRNSFTSRVNLSPWHSWTLQHYVTLCLLEGKVRFLEIKKNKESLSNFWVSEVYQKLDSQCKSYTTAINFLNGAELPNEISTDQKWKEIHLF